MSMVRHRFSNERWGGGGGGGQGGGGELLFSLTLEKCGCRIFIYLGILYPVQVGITGPTIEIQLL